MDFETLIQLPESKRDDAWEAHFLDGLIPRRVDLEGEEPGPGPDGLPYLKIRVTAGEGREPFANIVRWLATRGIGLVVNAHKMVPDYVFTYGMIWNFLETGRFVAPVDDRVPGTEALVTGAPTPKYLPLYVRNVLREFFLAQGFARPRVTVVTTADWIRTDLVFSTESLNGLSLEDQKTLAELLQWFLPPHYGLRFESEKTLGSFLPL